MGILNITPDSFYDGGMYADEENIRRRISEFVNAGARIIDVGGESSRPGSERVTAEEELARIKLVLPLVRQFREVIFSIDTYKPEVAEFALANGFGMINDITGGGDGTMFEIAASHGVPMVIMHMKGSPETMQKNPRYGNVVEEIIIWFRRRIDAALSAGLSEKHIILDPGIGFGKTVEHNDAIVRAVHQFSSLGYPVLIGASRKSFLSLDGDSPKDRLAASLVVLTISLMGGAHILRVHDVAESVKALRILKRIYPESGAFFQQELKAV